MAIGKTVLPISSSGGECSDRGVYVKDNNSSTGLANVVDYSSLSEMIKVGDSDHDNYMVATGDRHLLAIRNFSGGTGGELWVFGINTSGSIGGSSNFKWTRIGSDSDWTWVSTSGNSSYAIRAGRLYVTGVNTNGQLGNGTTTNIATFTQIGSDTDWEMIASGYIFALAIKGGDLLSTGQNANFKTGLGTSVGNTTTWTVVNNTEVWEWIAAGRFMGMAINTTGELYTWGANTNGMTGQGTTVGSTTTPTQVGVDTDWYRSDCGNANSYVSKTDGTLWGAGLASAASIWGASPSAASTFQQDSLGDTDWDWFHCNSANALYVRKTNGTLWSVGSAFINAHSTFKNQLTQIGTGTDWNGFSFGNKNNFAGEISFIKS